MEGLIHEIFKTKTSIYRAPLSMFYCATLYYNGRSEADVQKPPPSLFSYCSHWPYDFKKNDLQNILRRLHMRFEWDHMKNNFSVFMNYWFLIKYFSSLFYIYIKSVFRDTYVMGSASFFCILNLKNTKEHSIALLKKSDIKSCVAIVFCYSAIVAIEAYKRK